MDLFYFHSLTKEIYIYVTTVENIQSYSNFIFYIPSSLPLLQRMQRVLKFSITQMNSNKMI